MIPHTSKILLKILYAGLYAINAHEILDEQIGFVRSKNTKYQILNIEYIVQMIFTLYRLLKSV